MNDFNNTLADQHPALSMRLSETGPLLIAGLCEPLTTNSPESIPLLWQHLARRSAEIPDRIDSTGYGLCLNNNGFHYMAGYSVWDFANLSPGINHILIPAQVYGVFSHSGHVSNIRQTIDAIFDHWLPGSNFIQNLQANNPLYFFERYGESFDSETGMGDIEIWVPLRARA